MANFAAALPYLIQNEGGYSNQPGDKGGETMYGITVSTARKYGYTGPMASLPLNVASAIFQEWYWNPLYLDSVSSQSVATKLLDMSANFGPGTAAKLAQSAVNTLVDPPVDIDGGIGTDTLDSLNTADERDLLAALVQACVDRYQQIVAEDPSQEKWYQGWMNRASKIPGIVAGGIGTSVLLLIGLGLFLLFRNRGPA